MRTGRLAGWCLALVLAPAAALGAGPQKTLGVVPLRATNAPDSVVRSANGQLRATLAAITGLEVVEVELPAGTPADDPEALRKAAGLADVARIVGGEVIVHGDAGSVRLIAIDPEPGRKPSFYDRPLPSTRQEELLSALEAGVCQIIGEYSGASGCQGSLSLEGEIGGDAEILLDGVSVLNAPFIADLPVPLGAHKIQLRSGTLVSQERRVHIHYESTVKLRLAQQCNQLFVLDQGEEAGCSIALPLDIESTLRSDVGGSRVRWVPISAGVVGAVALLVGGVVGLQANASRDAALDGYRNNTLTLAEARRLNDAMLSNAGTANLLFVVGAVAGAAGAGLFVLDF